MVLPINTVSAAITHMKEVIERPAPLEDYGDDVSDDVSDITAAGVDLTVVEPASPSDPTSMAADGAPVGQSPGRCGNEAGSPVGTRHGGLLL